MANQGNIAVDIGNSTIKSGKFEGDHLVEKKWWKNLGELKAHYGAGNYHWIFASVAGNTARLRDHFSDQTYHILKYTSKLPVKLNYNTPETLGVDRLAAAVGAWKRHPGQNLLIIDAGSCITYDLLDARGVFQGGIIAPGLKMRMKAMAHFTSKLPDISDEWEKIETGIMGKSTKGCLWNGAYTGLVHEINGFIDRFRKEYPDLVVMLTGGDADHFESRLKGHIFADSNLVLAGLNTILNYNK